MTPWPPELLTPEELAAVAGSPQPSCIKEWLKKATVPHLMHLTRQPQVFGLRLNRKISRETTVDYLDVLERVKAKLEAGGFSGLYYPGECGCGIDDLAPCGECRHGEGEGDYINDCKPGYKHMDPNPGRVEFGDYIVSGSEIPPEPDEFASFYN